MLIAKLVSRLLLVPLGVGVGIGIGIDPRGVWCLVLTNRIAPLSEFRQLSIPIPIPTPTPIQKANARHQRRDV